MPEWLQPLVDGKMYGLIGALVVYLILRPILNAQQTEITKHAEWMRTQLDRREPPK